ncbi:hypothetical protein JCM11641_007418 [Rhodosporidiobolus odoratus]
MAQQFIGSLISLISKSDIRYQGVLHSIDPQAATVSLEKVRSLGTEGRKGDPAEEVAANDNVYDFIVFRASDVKDLQIEAPSSDSTPSDPAIVGTAAPTPAPAPAAVTPQVSAPSPPKPTEPQRQPPQLSAPGPQSPFLPPPPHLGGPGASPFGAYPPFPPSPFGGPPPFPPFGAPFPPFGAPNPFGPPGPFGAPPPFGAPGQLPPTNLAGAPQPPQNLVSPSVSAAAPRTSAGPKLQTPLTSPGLEDAVASAAHAKQLQSPKTAPAAPVTPQETRPTTVGAEAVAPASSEKTAVPVTSGPAAATASTAVPRQAADIEQLAKDMSRSTLAPQPTQQAPRRPRGEDGVGASIFSGPQSTRETGNRHGRHLQPFGNSGKPAVPLPDAEFDFEKANASFQKPHALPGTSAATSEDKAGAGEAPAPMQQNRQAPGAAGGEGDDFVVPPPTEAYYNPSKSFFDSISSDSKTRTDPAQQNAMGRYGGMGGGGYGGGRYDRAKERERNMEAFGETGAQMGRGGFRRGPGGGRGRRGPGGGGHAQGQGQGYQGGGGGGGYGRQNYGAQQ